MAILTENFEIYYSWRNHQMHFKIVHLKKKSKNLDLLFSSVLFTHNPFLCPKLYLYSISRI